MIGRTIRAVEVDGFKGKVKAFQGRRPDQKHGRDGKGFLGCLIFSHAKPLLLAAAAAVVQASPDAAPWGSAGIISLPCLAPQARLTASPSFPSRPARVRRLVWVGSRKKEGG